MNRRLGRDIWQRARNAGRVVVALCTFYAFHCTAEDWPKYRRDLSNTGKSAETGITSANVASLQERWHFATGGRVTASPAVATVGGISTLYIGAWNGVFYALNAVNGAKRWSFTLDSVGQCTPGVCRIGSSAAVDVSTNTVYFGARNAYLYALNASNGALKWKQQVGDPSSHEVWSSPAVYNGRVYVGISSHGDIPCIIGRVDAYTASTGNLDWSFKTIDQSTCPGCVGGSVWSSLAIDSDNGIVYADTGNPGSTCQPPTANADLYPDSVLALDADTGVLLNYFKAIGNDLNDKDFGSSPVLHSTQIDNECTNTTINEDWVTAVSKNGYAFTLKRDAGGLTGAQQANFLNNAGAIATPAVRPRPAVSSCAAGLRLITRKNNIYVPASNGALFNLLQDENGDIAVQGKVKVATVPIFSAPAVIKDVMIFGSADGNLHIHKVPYGGTAALRVIPIGSEIDSGPAISNSRIYFGANDGNLYCYSLNGN